MKAYTASYIFLYLLLSSCGLFNREEDTAHKAAIAKAFNHYLFKSDLEGLVPSGSSKSDSINIVSNYIDNWARQKVVLHKAEQNLDQEKKNVERQLEEYRNSLITYAYERELISQQLDTVVSEQEVASFYKQNLNNFQLKDNIIKVIYLKLSKKSPKLDKVRQWYRSNSEKDKTLLEDYCRQYAVNYYLNDNTWLLFDDLLKEIPLKTYDKEQFLQNNRIIEFEDSSLIYLVNIKGFMIKNSVSPLSFEKDNIRSMIINQRKLALIHEMESKAYESAKKDGDVELY